MKNLVYSVCTKHVLNILGICLLILSVEGSTNRPRGLRPELITFYNPKTSDGLFQCLDGSVTIKYLQVNDDYCDCPDGSDEPGTSACSNGKFYCLNKGYKPKILPSSRVNDGICDCCDGSDEWAGPLFQSGDAAPDSGCANVCMEMGKEEREERERLAKVIEEGAKMRNEMIQQGKDRKQQRQSEIETKKKEIEQVKVELEEKRALKETVEAPEKEALDKIKAEEDRLKQLREEEEKHLREQEALDIFDKLDANNDGQITKEELTSEIKFDQNNDGIVNDEEAEFYMSGNESYQRDTFLDNGWPLMKPALTEEEANDTKENSDPIPEYDGEDIDHLGSDNDDDDDDEEEEDYEDDEEATHVRQPSEPDEVAEEAPSEEPVSDKKYDDATQLLVDAADEARKEFDSVDRKHRDLERDIKHLEGVISKDYGPEEEFASLSGQCFEYTDQEYTYKMCAFDYCSQRPNSQGGGETRLGNWEKWEDELYTAQLYEHGVQCWNGPQRSTRVIMRCGLRNALVASTEPNRCEYQFIFETPALCKEIDLADNDSLEQNHDEL